MRKIFSVTSVDVTIHKSSPRQLLVRALGTVTTTGWKNIDLVPIADSAEDGIMDFDFVGTPPDGIFIPMKVEVSADYLIKDGDDLLGAVVNARTNRMAALVVEPEVNPFPAAFRDTTTLSLGEETFPLLETSPIPDLGLDIMKLPGSEGPLPDPWQDFRRRFVRSPFRG